MEGIYDKRQNKVLVALAKAGISPLPQGRGARAIGRMRSVCLQGWGGPMLTAEERMDCRG